MVKKIIFFILLFAFVLYGNGRTDQFRNTPKASADDGQEDLSGSVNISYTYIELVYGPSWQRWGGAIRIPNLTIPQGATIDGARLKVWSYSGSWNHVYDTIACYDVDSAPVIVVADYNISNRWANATTAKSLWHKNIYETFTYDSTCDLAPIIQEVVNRPGWKSGNAIMFLFKNKGAPDSSGFEIFSWEYPADGNADCLLYTSRRTSAWRHNNLYASSK